MKYLFIANAFAMKFIFIMTLQTSTVLLKLLSKPFILEERVKETFCILLAFTNGWDQKFCNIFLRFWPQNEVIWPLIFWLLMPEWLDTGGEGPFLQNESLQMKMIALRRRNYNCRSTQKMVKISVALRCRCLKSDLDSKEAVLNVIWKVLYNRHIIFHYIKVYNLL